MIIHHYTCPRYHDPHTATSYDRLPSHVRRTITDPDGNPAEVLRPVVEKTGQPWGILERVDATPKPGCRITESHGELLGDPAQWMEVIDAEVETLPELIDAAIEASKEECFRRIIERIDEKSPMRGLGKGLSMLAGTYPALQTAHFVAWAKVNIEAHQVWHDAAAAATTIAELEAVPPEAWPDWEEPS